MNYLLYENNKEVKEKVNISELIDIIEFTPRLFKLYWRNESKSLRTTFFRLYISILTRNKTKIYFALDKEQKIVHTSYTICKNFKYPFINKDEIVIGPCNTEESARGKGIYPFVLNYIVSNTNYKSYYLIIRPENKASIHGAEKAGFVLTERKIMGTKYLNRFKEIKK